MAENEDSKKVSPGGVVVGATETFKTNCTPPEVRAKTLTVIGSESATLEAEVLPLGVSTTFHFEYDIKPYTVGEAPHGTSVPIPDGSAGEATTWEVVSASTGSLMVCDEYHFRAVAKNEDGKVEEEDQHFKTKCPAPVVSTGVASLTNTFEPQLNATVNPEGTDTHYQFEYGLTETYGSKIPLTAEDIGSGRIAVAVSKTLAGLERNKTYHFRIVATNATGTSHGADKTFTTLPPCKGAEEKCVWSTQTTPNSPPRTEDTMTGVACVSSTNCVAVGKNAYTEGGFVEIWNGVEWKIKWELNGYTGNFLGISCGSVTSCMVIGETEHSGELRSEKLTYSEFFGTGEWGMTYESVATPSGGTRLKLGAISCASSTFCMAVGSYYNETRKDLIETWNGSAWSVQAPPGEGNATKAMRSVSCASTTSCITVGELSSKPTAEHWNGTEWSLMSPPNPTGAVGASLESVSCSSTTSCVAVGDFRESGKPNVTLVESWNGSSWSVQSSPNPSEAKEGSVLLGVSCLSSTSCFAVGDYSNEFFKLKTLAETWNGTSWSIQSSPNPTGSTSSSLVSDSCTSSITCTAVGSASPGPAGEATVTLAERYE